LAIKSSNIIIDTNNLVHDIFTRKVTYGYVYFVIVLLFEGFRAIYILSVFRIFFFYILSNYSKQCPGLPYIHKNNIFYTKVIEDENNITSLDFFWKIAKFDFKGPDFWKKKVFFTKLKHHKSLFRIVQKYFVPKI